MSSRLKVVGLLACFALATLPLFALWVDYPVTIEMHRVTAVIESVKATETNEVVDTGIAVGAVDCVYLDITYKILPNGPVVAGATKRKICDRLVAIDFLKKYKNRPLEGFWTGGAEFVPTSLLDRGELFLQTALSILLLSVSLICLNAVVREKQRGSEFL